MIASTPSSGLLDVGFGSQTSPLRQLEEPVLAAGRAGRGRRTSSVVEHADPVTLLEEHRDQGRADVAGAAGDEDSHGRCSILGGSRRSGDVAERAGVKKSARAADERRRGFQVARQAPVHVGVSIGGETASVADRGELYLKNVENSWIDSHATRRPSGGGVVVGAGASIRRARVSARSADVSIAFFMIPGERESSSRRGASRGGIGAGSSWVWGEGTVRISSRPL